MDLRVERTKRSIVNAFIELRSKKPLEKITIKELSESAFINKATFYSHYKDIYDLSEQLENETIEMILQNITHPEYLITKPKQSVKMLAVAFLSQERLIEILFSGSRKSVLVYTLENKIKERIFESYPEYKNNIEKNILLTSMIRGNFYAFLSYYDGSNAEEIIKAVGNINEKILG